MESNSGVITYNTGEMSSSSNDIKSQAKTFIDNYAEFYKLIDEVLESGFTGDLSDNFRATVKARREAFEEMGEILNTSSKEIDTDVERIQSNESKLKSMYDSNNYLNWEER